jgi:protein-L-isoaspartate(D-aspartate) O-methyltransferase
MTDWAQARRKMVDEQIRARGINDPRVLAAMTEVPRELFVPPSQRAHATEDHPLPIGHGQTISQPYIVARVAELCALRGHERVLEVGVGSGYGAAVLARLAREVYALELVPELTALARANLAAAGEKRVVVETRDGTLGWPEHQPYDAIVISAGAPRVPALLLAQLADGGRLVAPVGDREEQVLVVIERRGEEYTTRTAGSVRFVDLRGRYGFGGMGAPSA